MDLLVVYGDVVEVIVGMNFCGWDFLSFYVLIEELNVVDKF